MINELSDRFGVKIEFEAAPPKDFQSVEAQVASIENWTAKKIRCRPGLFSRGF